MAHSQTCAEARVFEVRGFEGGLLLAYNTCEQPMSERSEVRNCEAIGEATVPASEAGLDMSPHAAEMWGLCSGGLSCVRSSGSNEADLVGYSEEQQLSLKLPFGNVRAGASLSFLRLLLQEHSWCVCVYTLILS